ncbi:Glycosyl transferase, group 2 family protein [Sinorhizobium sojae CCBAU 05684]|uniref:Glycosyl transferase, group 2 family protein n=1 Tax=Sinorhizobium sojae CCBAU 05684 TaxID=716928 RepID=A0A249P7P6_9HYPH|nr:glycosyltransferase [Sinorhizobium sojae]ASY61752.1 Glycosyl transferase, group 2 family protein [Sinorhizobium sojae CCBAU 05684]
MSNGQDISIHFQCELENRADIDLVVVVPIFSDPDHLVKTLKTIVSQRPDVPLATLVVENGGERPTGADAAKAFFLNHPSDSAVIICRRRGRCQALNAGLSQALERYPNLQAIAVIGDDEVAAPEWLDGLMAVQEAYRADIVGGPQLPVFKHPQELRWKRHPVFAPPYDASGPVPMLYSASNVLVTRAVLEGMPQPFLDPAMDIVGGCAVDLFHRCKAAGFSFAWAADAWVTQSVPEHHATAAWVRATSLRRGTVSAYLARRSDPTLAGRLKRLGTSLALMTTSLPRGVKLWAKTGLAFAALYYFHVARGRVTAEVGLIGRGDRKPGQ